MNAIAHADLVIDGVEQEKSPRRDGKRLTSTRPTWRPPLPNVQVPFRPSLATTASRRVSVENAGLEVTLERLLFVLLVVAAVIGVAYGFSCLLDLVQNWAVFESGTTKLI